MKRASYLAVVFYHLLSLDDFSFVADFCRLSFALPAKSPSDAVSSTTEQALPELGESVCFNFLGRSVFVCLGETAARDGLEMARRGDFGARSNDKGR